MPASDIRVRRAKSSDLVGLQRLGLSTDAFRVNDAIDFYEQKELEEWIRKPKYNILLTAHYRGKLVGFLFCKVMSYHWALLDNFYVASTAPTFRVARRLFSALQVSLVRREIVYLSTLIKAENKRLEMICLKLGLERQGSYHWLDATRAINE